MKKRVFKENLVARTVCIAISDRFTYMGNSLTIRDVDGELYYQIDNKERFTIGKPYSESPMFNIPISMQMTNYMFLIDSMFSCFKAMDPNNPERFCTKADNDYFMKLADYSRNHTQPVFMHYSNNSIYTVDDCESIHVHGDDKDYYYYRASCNGYDDRKFYVVTSDNNNFTDVIEISDSYFSSSNEVPKLIDILARALITSAESLDDEDESGKEKKDVES